MSNIQLYNKGKHTNLILKLCGNSCNINCSYCFEKKKEVENGLIKFNEINNLINRLPTTCSIVLHGGEPLLAGTEYIDDLLTLLGKYYPDKINAIRVQTNGTLIDRTWIELLFDKHKKLNVEIAISLDGTEIMNGLRLDYNGNNTFNSVIQAFNLLADHGICSGMLSVISKQSLGMAKEYIGLISSIKNLSFVKVNPLFNMENGNLFSESLTPNEFVDFVLQITSEYIESGLYKHLAIEPILSVIQRTRGIRSRYCNYSCRKCFNYISVYPDGKLGPCDCLSCNDFAIIDDSKDFSDSINIAANSGKSEILQRLIDECIDCDINELCLSGCLSQRLYFLDNTALYKEYCQSKHRLFNAFKKLRV